MVESEMQLTMSNATRNIARSKASVSKVAIRGLGYFNAGGPGGAFGFSSSPVSIGVSSPLTVSIVSFFSSSEVATETGASVLESSFDAYCASDM